VSNYPRLKCPLPALALAERLNDVNAKRQRGMINNSETERE